MANERVPKRAVNLSELRSRTPERSLTPNPSRSGSQVSTTTIRPSTPRTPIQLGMSSRPAPSMVKVVTQHRDKDSRELSVSVSPRLRTTPTKFLERNLGRVSIGGSKDGVQVVEKRANTPSSRISSPGIRGRTQSIERPVVIGRRTQSVERPVVIGRAPTGSITPPTFSQRNRSGEVTMDNQITRSKVSRGRMSSSPLTLSDVNGG